MYHSSISSNGQTFQLTPHAQKRMAQRNLAREDLVTVLTYGERVYRTGVIFFFLGKRNIPEDCRQNSRFAQLVSATVIVEGGKVKTAYRDGDLREIKRKKEYQIRC